MEIFLRRQVVSGGGSGYVPLRSAEGNLELAPSAVHPAGRAPSIVKTGGRLPICVAQARSTQAQLGKKRCASEVEAGAREQEAVDLPERR